MARFSYEKFEIMFREIPNGAIEVSGAISREESGHPNENCRVFMTNLWLRKHCSNCRLGMAGGPTSSL